MSNTQQALIWNFEIDKDNPLLLEHFSAQEKEDIRWERRYFWSDQERIRLHGLDDCFLKLSDYAIKKHSDVYFLLADNDANIKLRRGELLYKPLIKQVDDCYGFGKKIPISDSANPELKQIFRQAEEGSQRLTVNKETLTYKLKTKPGIKMELARLEIEGKIYFSVCVEGRSLNLVQSISKHLLKGQKSCDYVSFLKTKSKP